MITVAELAHALSRLPQDAPVAILFSQPIPPGLSSADITGLAFDELGDVPRLYLYHA